MSALTEGGPLNGHISPEEIDIPGAASDQRGSDSDPSDARPQMSDRRSPSPPAHAEDELNGVDEGHDPAESDASTPDNASEDADFDVQESPASNHDEAMPDRPSSSDSNRAPKRKAAVVEDDFMRANPELYGLRRSVRALDNTFTFCSRQFNTNIITRRGPGSSASL